LTKATHPYAKSVCKGKVVDVEYTTRDHYFYITCDSEEGVVKTRYNFNEITHEFIEEIK